MNKRGQAYTLDALVSLIIMVIALTVCLSLSSVSLTEVGAPTSAERILGELLLRYEIQLAIYENDAESIRAYIESMLPKGSEYYFAVFDEYWNKLFEVGKDIEGISAIAQLVGINGTIRVRYVVFKVKI